MSYQVLARKWRPKNFREMVGQEHVLRALINALDHGRLHHAYLFTGTRGVGKTTIARILARCFNCELGISSAPCGECSTCVEIGEGRSVDLIEVDAASRTKVEDTRELLDNVQYAPTRSRYKIYLIDEVHMLSNHSFNALLKTLEEPPEHVKFLLATTDPQKLPITILSRCLQFNLKNMSPERIVAHLQNVLGEEVVPFDEPALWLLAHAADGSMRDALSLTDQAIAFGNGHVAENEVAAMLGTINPRLVQNLIESLIAEDAKQLLALVASFSEHAPDYSAALADLLNMLHRIAVGQAAPDALDNSLGDREIILHFAENIAAEDVQLFYQTALIGRRDLSFAANPRSGFEMTLLRMLAFKPQGLAQLPSRGLKGAGKKNQGDEVPATEVAGGVKKPIAEPQRFDNKEPQRTDNQEPQRAGNKEPQAKPAAQSAVQPNNVSTAQMAPKSNALQNGSYAEPKNAVPPASQTGKTLGGSAATLRSSEPSTAAKLEKNIPQYGEQRSAEGRAENRGEKREVSGSAEMPAGVTSPAKIEKTGESTASGKPSSQFLREQIKQIAGSEGFIDKTAVKPKRQPDKTEAKQPLEEGKKVSLQGLNPQTWVQVYKQLNIKGILQSTAANCVLLGREQNFISMAMDDGKGTLFDPSHIDRLQGLLCDYFGEVVKLEINLMPLGAETETPAVLIEREKQQQHQAVVEDLQSDPVIQTLQREFGAHLIENSIKSASGN